MVHPRILSQKEFDCDGLVIGVATFSSVFEKVVDVAAESEILAADGCVEKHTGTVRPGERRGCLRENSKEA